MEISPNILYSIQKFIPITRGNVQIKILVTGGAGFIGSHVVDAYLAQGHEVIVLDDLSTGKKENLNPSAKFYEMDIQDENLIDVFEREQPEVVNHHAAQIDVRKSVIDPKFDARANILGTINVLEACVKCKVKKIIFASSGGAVYGEPQYLPVDEVHPKRPISPYGVSKLSGEFYIQAYHDVHGLKFTILRYGNVYGPRQDPLGEAGVIAIFCSQMLKGTPPKIFGTGESLRDYVYVKDVVEANIIALLGGDNVAVNIGTGIGTSVNELFKNLSSIIGFAQDPIYCPPRPGELDKIFLAPDLARKELGWEPTTDIMKGLVLTADYFRNRTKTK